AGALESSLGAKPAILYQRRGPPEDGAVWAGDAWLVAIGIFLAVLIALAARIGRRRLASRSARVGIAAAALPLGLVGLFLWTLAIASAFSELIYNEVLLILVPFDLAIPVLKDRPLLWYVRGRLLVIAIVSLLRATGA